MCVRVCAVYVHISCLFTCGIRTDVDLTYRLCRCPSVMDKGLTVDPRIPQSVISGIPKVSRFLITLCSSQMQLGVGRQTHHSILKCQRRNHLSEKCSHRLFGQNGPYCAARGSSGPPFDTKLESQKKTC